MTLSLLVAGFVYGSGSGATASPLLALATSTTKATTTTVARTTTTRATTTTVRRTTTTTSRPTTTTASIYAIRNAIVTVSPSTVTRKGRRVIVNVSKFPPKTLVTVRVRLNLPNSAPVVTFTLTTRSTGRASGYFTSPPASATTYLVEASNSGLPPYRASTTLKVNA